MIIWGERLKLVFIWGEIKAQFESKGVKAQ